MIRRQDDIHDNIRKDKYGRIVDFCNSFCNMPPCNGVIMAKFIRGGMTIKMP